MMPAAATLPRNSGSFDRAICLYGCLRGRLSAFRLGIIPRVPLSEASDSAQAAVQRPQEAAGCVFRAGPATTGIGRFGVRVKAFDRGIVHDGNDSLRSLAVGPGAGDPQCHWVPGCSASGHMRAAHSPRRPVRRSTLRMAHELGGSGVVMVTGLRRMGPIGLDEWRNGCSCAGGRCLGRSLEAAEASSQSGPSPEDGCWVSSSRLRDVPPLASASRRALGRSPACEAGSCEAVSGLTAGWTWSRCSIASSAILWAL